MMKTELCTPLTDGIDHINVYSRGRTPEGRLLSNFAFTPFTLQGARFASVEGFYHSLLFDEDERRAEIAALWGKEAKAWGKRTGKRPGGPLRTWDGRTVAFHSAEFDAEFIAAVRAKVAQNPGVQEALLATEELPLLHYYVMFGRALLPQGENGAFTDCLTAERAALRKRTKAEGSVEVAALVEALNDPSESVRRRAMRTLVQIELPAEEALQIFTAATANGSVAVRAVAVKRLDQGRLRG